MSRCGRAVLRTAAAGALVAAASVPHATAPAAGETRPGGQSDGRSDVQYCTDAGGVTVVVDLRDLDPDADVVVRCAEGPTGSGYTGFDALADAGIGYEMPVRQPGMVCRVLGRPATTEQLPVEGDEDYVERCVDAPPTAAYWSYWHAPEGGRWQYSSAGPGNRDAIPGGFEGWSFSLNHTESTAPAPRVAPENPHAPYGDGGDGDGGDGDDGDGGEGNGGSVGGPGSGGSGGDGPPTAPPPTGSPDGGASTPVPTTAPDDQSAPGPSTGGPTTPSPNPVRDNSPGGPGPGGRDGDGTGLEGGAGRGDGEPGQRGDQDARAGPGGGRAERTPGVSVTSDVPQATPGPPSGPPVSTLVGAAALAGLAVLGAGLAWRRRARGTGTQ